MFQLGKFNESDFGDLTKPDNLPIESHSSPGFQFYYVKSSLKNEEDFHKIFSTTFRVKLKPCRSELKSFKSQ